MPQAFQDFLFQLQYLYTHLTPSAIADMVLVGVVFFLIFQTLRQTRALQLLSGAIILLLFGAVLFFLLPFNAFNYMLGGLLLLGLISLPTLFQDELRRVFVRFSQVGRWQTGDNGSTDPLRSALLKGLWQLSEERHGALIVFEGRTTLSDIIETGIPLNAGEITSELLRTIFHPKTPLHDGAVVIQQGRLAAAGCILPVATAKTGNAHLGTRHRAGLGLSQQVRDALILVVSEETGNISVAYAGVLHQGLNETQVENWYERYQGQFTEPQTKAIRELLRGVSLYVTLRNFIASFILAVVVWTIVIYQVDPPQQVTIRNVPVSVTVPSEGLFLVSDPVDTVNVLVQTTREKADELSVNAVRAALDLSALEAGVHRIGINVSLADSNAQIVSVTPNVDNVTLEPTLMVSLTPRVSIVGLSSLPAGFVVGDIAIAPGEVTLSGPESAINQVVEALVEVELNGATTDFQEAVPVTLLDSNGDPITSLQASPAEVIVTVPIRQTFFTRQIAVQAVISETLPTGYEITRIRVTPPIVTLRGASTQLAEAGEVLSTTPISLVDVFSTLSVELPLDLPPGLTAVDSAGNSILVVQVDIVVQPLTDYLVLNLSPTFFGVDDSSGVSASPEEVALLLIGPRPLLEQIEAEPVLVGVSVNLAGLEPGTHTVSLRITAPEGLNIEVFPTEIQVTIPAPSTEGE